MGIWAGGYYPGGGDIGGEIWTWGILTGGYGPGGILRGDMDLQPIHTCVHYTYQGRIQDLATWGGG